MSAAPTDFPQGCVASSAKEPEVNQVVSCIFSHPLHREFLLKALGFCRQACTQDQVELFLSSQPEYAAALQDAIGLVRQLEQCGGIARVVNQAGVEGEEILSALRGSELHDEEFVQTTSLRDCTSALSASPSQSSSLLMTTAAGRAAAELASPRRRLLALLQTDEPRRGAFSLVLEFCQEPRTLSQIKSRLAGHEALSHRDGVSCQQLQASFFIDKLAAAGGLVRDGGWVDTDQAKECLAELVH